MHESLAFAIRQRWKTQGKIRVRYDAAPAGQSLEYKLVDKVLQTRKDLPA